MRVARVAVGSLDDREQWLRIVVPRAVVSVIVQASGVLLKIRRLPSSVC